MALQFPDDMKILKKYLYIKDMSASQLAKAIKYSPSTISNYLRGDQRLSRRVAELIEAYSHGEVPAEQLLAENPPLKKTRIVKNDLADKGGE